MTYRQAPNQHYTKEAGHGKLLKEIAMVDFAIVELTLYLDTHANDHDAVTYIKQYISISKHLKEEYAKLYGPLVVCDADFNECEQWKWAIMPLPWEGGCK